jgi:hypothetical protein
VLLQKYLHGKICIQSRAIEGHTHIGTHKGKEKKKREKFQKTGER